MTKARPEAATRPVGVVKPVDSMDARLASTAPVERLTWRLDDIAKALGISRRALERERSAGRFPQPDLTIGKMPLWRVETIRAWVAGGAQA